MLSILSFLGWGWGGGTRHPELDAVREREEESRGGVIKLASIIALDTLDGATKLR
jgi:hypothetical protein